MNILVCLNGAAQGIHVSMELPRISCFVAKKLSKLQLMGEHFAAKQSRQEVHQQLNWCTVVYEL